MILSKYCFYFYLYDNYLDFNKSQYINKLIYDKWRLLTSGFLDEPSPLTELEQVACSQSNRGGLHYNSKIKNDILKNNNVYYYDINKMYLYTISHENFIFPNHQGEQLTLNSNEFNEFYNK